VQALKVALLQDSPPRATETQSTEAYTLYVLGIGLVNDHAVSPEIAVKSIEEALVWP